MFNVPHSPVSAFQYFSLSAFPRRPPFKVRGSTVQGSRFDGSRFEVRRFKVRRFEVQGSRFNGSRFKVQRFNGSRFNGSTVRGSRFNGSRFNGSTAQAFTVPRSPWVILPRAIRCLWSTRLPCKSRAPPRGCSCHGRQERGAIYSIPYYFHERLDPPTDPDVVSPYGCRRFITHRIRVAAGGTPGDGSSPGGERRGPRPP